MTQPDQPPMCDTLSDTARAPELKPCPFCGGAAFIGQDFFNDAAWVVDCANHVDCPISFEGIACAQRAEAVAMWNRRAARSSVEAAPADAKEREIDDLLTAFECACLASDSFEGRRTLRAEIRALLRASSSGIPPVGEPVSQQATTHDFGAASDSRQFGEKTDAEIAQALDENRIFAPTGIHWAMNEAARRLRSGGIPRSLSEEPGVWVVLDGEGLPEAVCMPSVQEQKRRRERIVELLGVVHVPAGSAPLPSSEPSEGVVRCAKCERWHSGVNTADVKTNLCEDCAPSSERAVSDDERKRLANIRARLMASGEGRINLHLARPIPDADVALIQNCYGDLDFALALIDRLVPSPGSEPRASWGGDTGTRT